MDTIRRGSRGTLVRRWQEFLRDRGFDPNGVDGIFGRGTRSATQDFQRHHGLSADGVVGQNTWNKAIEQGFSATGRTPTPPQRVTRKSVRNLSAEELEDLRTAMTAYQAIRDTRGYNDVAGIHGAPDGACVHQDVLFLPWHRAYLYVFEQGLRDIDPTVSQPWWDWRSDRSRMDGIPDAYADATTPDGTPNPLASARIRTEIIRWGTQQTIDRPTQRDVNPPSLLPFPYPPPGRRVPDRLDNLDELLSISDFEDFTRRLELVHNFLHVWAGGDMASVRFAAYDPLFWAHHCMVDRIWYLWQLRHGIDNMPRTLLDRPLQPFNLTVRDVLNVADLGYGYAGTTISIGTGN
jgi:tyrosinase